MTGSNRLTLSGTIAALDALRHTPAGIALVEFVLAHDSQQAEAGAARQVKLEMRCVAVERDARLIAAAPLGSLIEIEGFLAPKGKSSRQLVLHVAKYEFKQGATDGNVR
ncbi:MAG: primosomal replication protein N [Burkholderiales bacterium]